MRGCNGASHLRVKHAIATREMAHPHGNSRGFPRGPFSLCDRFVEEFGGDVGEVGVGGRE